MERLDKERTRGQTGLTAGPAAQRPTGWGGGEALHRKPTHRRERAAPYSRSSSSYNSLYLLLLNLKEKTGFPNKKMPIFCTDTREREKKRKKEKRKRDRIS